MSESPICSPELPSLGIVATMEPEDRAMLASYGTFRFLQAGQAAIQQGQAQDALYFVISGILHAQRSEGSSPVLVGTIKAGECFGEVNIFDPAEASATVVAVEAAQLWLISREELEAFVSTYPQAANHLLVNIATQLAGRLRAVSRQLVDKVEYMSLVEEIRHSGGA
jgi:CRP-like cAMP-binding protein